MRIEYHRTLLADRVRNRAFHEALKTVIVPGRSVVADIGCGTGFLGFMAARLGAKRVFLIERGEIVEVARKLARQNGIRNIEIVPAHSTEVTPPQKVDVVVSETLGNYAFEENIIETLADARARYLAPGGVMIPQAVTQYVAPVTTDRVHRELAAWDDVGYDLDFAPAKRMSLNNIYVRVLKAADLLDRGASAVAFDAVDLTRPAKTARKGSGRWTLPAGAGPATVYGAALWWSARLVEGIEIATGPLDPPTHWEQLYLPALEPVVVPGGGSLEIAVRSTTSYAKGTNLVWTLTVRDRKGRDVASQTMDLNKGFVP